MTKSDRLGVFEQLILLALVRLGTNAYGMTIRREIESRTGQSTSLGAVYITLDRLERKGYVRSHDGSPAAERQWRARRFFQIEPPGEHALIQALDAVDRMRAGVPRAGRLSPAPEVSG
ncbi:MAG: PadR family transcriptional regulator [Dehalococcoidia bacterium]